MLESPAARARFLEKLEALGAPPPWSESSDDPGEILDANGAHVLVVDHNRQISDVQARELALWVITAVNAAAGERR